MSQRIADPDWFKSEDERVMELSIPVQTGRYRRITDDSTEYVSVRIRTVIPVTDLSTKIEGEEGEG